MLVHAVVGVVVVVVVVVTHDVPLITTVFN
jgi:hypothetical protein